MALQDMVSAIMREVAEDVVRPRFCMLGADDIAEKSPGEIVTCVDHEAETRLQDRLAGLGLGARIVGEEAASRDPRLLDDLDDWTLDQRHDDRHLMNAVLIEMRRRPPDEAKAWVARRARELLRGAERHATALPSGIQPLVLWLAGRIGNRLDAG